VAVFVPPASGVEASTVGRRVVVVLINGAEWLTVRVVQSISSVTYIHLLTSVFSFAFSSNHSSPSFIKIDVNRNELTKQVCAGNKSAHFWRLLAS